MALTFCAAQHAGARDDKSNPVIRDFYNSQLTARSPFSVSYFLGFHMFRHTINIVVFFPIFITLHCSGNASDDTLLAKFESIYTDSGDHSSTMVGINAYSFPKQYSQPLLNISCYLFSFFFEIPLSPAIIVACSLFSTLSKVSLFFLSG